MKHIMVCHFFKSSSFPRCEKEGNVWEGTEQGVSFVEAGYISASQPRLHISDQAVGGEYQCAAGMQAWKRWSHMFRMIIALILHEETGEELTGRDFFP